MFKTRPGLKEVNLIVVAFTKTQILYHKLYYYNIIYGNII